MCDTRLIRPLLERRRVIGKVAAHETQAMAKLEVRRHSIRKPGAGSQVSQEGVDLARRVSFEIGPFVRVVASVVPRVREAAIAMGVAVDHEVVTLGTDPGLYEQASTAVEGPLALGIEPPRQPQNPTFHPTNCSRLADIQHHSADGL